MKYRRVLPRDAFNEANLLKCLGQIALNIHHGKAREQLTLEFEEGADERDFVVEQDPSHGGLYCTNARLRFQDEPIHVVTRYNSRDPYPLDFEDDYIGLTGPVFDPDGNFTQEFFDYVESIKFTL